MCIAVVQLLSPNPLFATPQTYSTPGAPVFHYLREFALVRVHKLVMLSNHLILCCPLLLLLQSFSASGLLRFMERGKVILGFPGGLVDKESACSAGDSGDADLIPGSQRSLEAWHSSILVWRIPWTEEPRLQSVGLQRVRHDWSDWARTCKK